MAAQQHWCALCADLRDEICERMARRLIEPAEGFIENDGIDSTQKGLRHDDLLAIALGQPTYRASMPPEVLALSPPALAPKLVVEEVLDALGSCPSLVPGRNNRELIAALGALPRDQQVEAMATAHAGFAKRRHQVTRPPDLLRGP
jgi:hypothetical protein